MCCSSCSLDSSISRCVDPREVKARLDRQQTQFIFGQGYALKVVKEAIERRLRYSGKNTTF